MKRNKPRRIAVTMADRTHHGSLRSLTALLFILSILATPCNVSSDWTKESGWSSPSFEAPKLGVDGSFNLPPDHETKWSFNSTATQDDTDSLRVTEIRGPVLSGPCKFDFVLLFDDTKWSTNYASDPFVTPRVESQEVFFHFQRRDDFAHFESNFKLRTYFETIDWKMGGGYGDYGDGKYYLCLGLKVLSYLDPSVLAEAKEVITLYRPDRLYTPTLHEPALSPDGHPLLSWTLSEVGTAQRMVIHRSYDGKQIDTVDGTEDGVPIEATAGTHSWPDPDSPCGKSITYWIATRSDYPLPSDKHEYHFPLSKWSDPVSITPPCGDPPPPPSPTPPPPNENCSLDPSLWGVIFYSDPNFQGRCSHRIDSHPNFSYLRVGNDAVSSVRINGQFQVRIYEHPDFQGRYVEVNHSEPNLDVTSLGEQFSSVSIIQKTDCDDEGAPGVFLYETPGFGGSCQRIDSDVGDLGLSAVGDNNVSSVRINGEYKVTLFEHTDFRGRSDEINKSDSNLDVRSLGGQYSSVRVETPVQCEKTDLLGVHVFSERNYKGNCAHISGDVGDFESTPVGNDGPRSLRIIGPYHVKMYEHRSYQGRYDEFGSNQADLTRRSLGDQYSSLQFFANNQLPTLTLSQANSQSVVQNDQVMWSNQQQWTFAGTASDVDGVVSRVEFGCEGDSCNLHNQPVSGTTSWTYTRNGLTGRNRIYFHAFDDDGARSRTTDRHSITLNIDLAQPATVLGLNGDATAANRPAWFTGPVTVRLQAEDGSTGRARAGVQEVRYRVDGGAWQAHTGNDISFTIAADGGHAVEYYALDKVGNQESGQSVSFNLDQTPPAPPGGVVETQGAASGVWQRAANTPTFTWDAATDATSGVWGYQFYLGPDPNGEAYQTFMAGEPRTWTPQPAGVRTGTYYLRGRTRDNAGNWSPWTSLFTFRYDGAPPENPSGVAHAAGVGNDIWQRTTAVADFTWPVPHDEGSGIKGYGVYWGSDPAGTSADFITASRYMAGALCGSDQACAGYLRLRSQDNVDNLAQDWTTAFVLRYDGAPPRVDFTFNGGITQTQQTLVTLDIAATDEGSGVQQMRLSADGESWTPWEVYATKRQWQIPAISRQWWPVYVQVQDGVGLASEVISHSIYLEVNTDQPRSDSYRLFDHALSAGAGAQNSAGYQGRGTLGQTLDAAGARSSHFALVGGYEAGSQALPIVKPAHDEFEFANGIFASGIVAETLHSPTFQMIGTLGELGLPNNQTTLNSSSYQHQPGFLAARPSSAAATPTPTPTPGPTPTPTPAPACAEPRVRINGSAAFTSHPSVELDICSPNAVEMQVSNSEDFAGAQWEPYVSAKAWTLPTAGQQVLPRFVYVAFKATDGTISSTHFDDIIYDPNAPAGAISAGDSVPAATLAAAAGQANPVTTAYRAGKVTYLARTDSASLAQPLAVLAPNADGAVNLYINAMDDNSGMAEMQVSGNADFSAATWEPFSALKPYAPADGDGVKTVYARFRDEASNVSASAETSFMLDTEAPYGGIALDQRVVGPDVITTTVYLGAEDNLSGVADVRLSLDQDLSDAAWQPYTSTVTWPISLTAESAGTLYGQYRDLAGNVSGVYTDTYAVDLTPPQVYVEVEPAETLTRTVHVFAYDELATLDVMTLSNDPLMADGVVTMPYSGTVTWSFDERRVVWVQVKDAVGNITEPYPAYADEVMAPMSVAVAISEDSANTTLTWEHLSSNSRYEVWRGTTPYFDPDQPDADTTRRAVLDPPASGTTMMYQDANGQYYYLVRSLNQLGVYADSIRAGRFEFQLVPGGN